VLWTTTYLQSVQTYLANLGRPVPQDLLQHLSPLGWHHINLTGDYLYTDLDTQSEALRPLRLIRAVEGPAKPQRISGSVLFTDPKEDNWLDHARFASMKRSRLATTMYRDLPTLTVSIW
jgi:hypothetical protein